MNLMNFFKIFFLFLIYESCNSDFNQKEPSKQVAQLIYSVDKFNDSVFFSHAQCLSVDKGQIYMTDYANNRVITFSEDLELIDMFGESGNGPGELLFADKLFVTESSLLVEENLRLSEFGMDGKFLRTIKPPKNLGTGDLTVRFAAFNNNIIASGINNKIIVFDKNSNVIDEYGGYYNAGYIPEKFWPRVRSHLFITKNKTVISASSNDPVIELYDNKKLLARCIYDTLTSLDYKWKSLEEFYSKDNYNMRQLVPDAFYSDSDKKLYLLLVDTILVFTLDNNQIRFNEQIIFNQNKESDYFMSLAVKDRVLYLFNHVRGTIEKYKIN